MHSSQDASDIVADRSVASAGFRNWAEQNNLTRQTVGCGALAWEDCYNQTQATSALDLASQNPTLSYWWTRMAHDYGIDNFRQVTDAITSVVHTTNVWNQTNVGANLSPGNGYGVGGAHAFVRAIREGAFTLPWGEGWVWQSPLASPQTTSMLLQLFQAGLRDYSEPEESMAPARPIMWYAM